MSTISYFIHFLSLSFFFWINLCIRRITHFFTNSKNASRGIQRTLRSRSTSHLPLFFSCHHNHYLVHTFFFIFLCSRQSYYLILLEFFFIRDLTIRHALDIHWVEREWFSPQTKRCFSRSDLSLLVYD